ARRAAPLTCHRTLIPTDGRLQCSRCRPPLRILYPRRFRVSVSVSQNPSPSQHPNVSSPVRSFMQHNFRHFNARELVAAAEAYRHFVSPEQGGKMMVTLAGAMSTAEIGVSLAEMIRQGKVHAITCTAANLEEDIFNLVAHKDYKVIQDWRALSVEDGVALRDSGFNRVT